MTPNPAAAEQVLAQRLKKLGEHLGLRPDEASCAWDEIESALMKMHNQLGAEQAVQEIQTAKRRLMSIAAACRRLANLLTDEPLRRPLILGEPGFGHFAQLDEIPGECLGAIDVKEAIAAELRSEAAPKEFIASIEEIAARARICGERQEISRCVRACKCCIRRCPGL